MQTKWAVVSLRGRCCSTSDGTGARCGRHVHRAPAPGRPDSDPHNC